jgi:murein peptide amidase A
MPPVRGLVPRQRRSLIGFAVTLTLAGSVATAVLANDETPARQSNRPAIAHAPVRAVRLRARRLIIGHSIDGRPIYAMQLGDRHSPRTLLVVGCIHGDEPAGIAVARRLTTAAPPPAASLWIIPDLNPDGVKEHTRQNARGVDLNRNFPWHWQPLGMRGDPQYSGVHPLSEPEARAAYRLINRIRPLITIWFHQPEAVVDLSGGDARVERTFASLVDLPIRRLPRYPGSAINWENRQLPRGTAFDVELPRGKLSSAAIARYTDAVATLGAALVSGVSLP